MSEAELPHLTARVLWAAFALALAFGAIARRTHFCTMGALADLRAFGDSSRLRMWVLAIGVAVLGFNAMAALGWVRAGHSLYTGPRLPWLAHAVGGVLFGIGMVLASGCGSRTLVRAGGGNLKAWVVLLVLGFSAAASLRGVVAVARAGVLEVPAVDFPPGQDLPSLLSAWLGAPRPTLALALGAVVGGGLVAWVLAHRDGRRGDVLLGGLGIGALVVGLWWVSGRLGHLAEHPLTLEEAFVATDSRRMESFSFVAPVAYALDWLTLFSDRGRMLSIGIVAVAGVLLGSAAVALAERSFRWEGFGGVEDTANHLVGAALMGVGGVAAMGCTVGQGLSGVSTLSLGSALALAGIVVGGLAGLRYQQWRVERSA